jgi:hypothetical protein
MSINVSDVYSGNFLKAEHIKGTVSYVIENVTVEEFDADDKVKKKLVLAFEGEEKRLVVNTTNASIITENLGGETDAEKWVGQTIRLTVKKVEYAGKLVPAIRVVIEANEPEPTHGPMGKPKNRVAAPQPSDNDGPPDDDDQAITAFWLEVKKSGLTREQGLKFLNAHKQNFKAALADLMSGGNVPV